MADPLRIIDTDITCGMIAGVPTVLLQPDVLLPHKDRVRDCMEDMVDEAIHAEESRHSWGQRVWRFLSGKNGPFANAAPALATSLAKTFRRASEDVSMHGMAIPTANIIQSSYFTMPGASKCGRDRYVPMHAAIVTLPSADMRFDDVFRFRRNYTRMGCPVLDPGAAVFRYGATCHEIGHVAGGDEPQADMVGALFTRRAFGNTPMPQMLADFRAIDTVMDGVWNLYRGRELRTASNPYGWEMVESLDDISAMPQQAINRMNDDDILDTVFTPCPRDVQRSELLTRIVFNELAYPVLPRAWHAVEVADAAQRAHFQTQIIGDPLTERMAARLALAAQRIVRGNLAYRFQL
jgi:hypothetical protein